MSGIIILLLCVLILVLLLIQNVTATVTAAKKHFHAEIDYSIIKIILNKSDNNSEQKHKSGGIKNFGQKQAFLFSLPPSLNFLLSRSSITINSVTLVQPQSDPYGIFTRAAVMRSLYTLFISLLSSRAKELRVTDGVLNIRQETLASLSPAIDFCIVCRLYNLFAFGVIFLFESIKRRFKNVRKQNE